MKINLKQAVRAFFQNPSLEMVFIEAVANSIDANATQISIDISMKSLSHQESLEITITDNGEGFTDERFKKFGELLSVNENTHKGVGRLVYLAYFDEILVESQYGKTKRTFTYDASFDEDKSDMKTNPEVDEKFETKIVFKKCSLQRLSSYNVVLPDYLKRRLLEEFYPKFYLKKEEKNRLDVSIGIHVSEISKNISIGNRKTIIKVTDIPEMKTANVDARQIQLFENMDLKYSIIKRNDFSSPFIITALCIDDRTYNIKDVISDENVPNGYECVFLLSSTVFDGQVDASRQILQLNDTIKRGVVKLFRDKISEIFKDKIPEIAQKNEKTKESLSKTFPHLVGYFEEEEIGVISRDKSIEIAQKKYLRDQKVILESDSLDDDRFDKTIEISSRALAEYIIYREKIIEKIRTITTEDPEAEIHNLIMPKRAIYRGDDVLSNVYSNNLWLLDNKYMTYSVAMSERTMKEIAEEISDEIQSGTDNNKPDIAIIFSDNPQVENKKVDVVIIEFKKRGIKLAKTEEVISQLRQRARKLMRYYPEKIQRIWFYGIVEFTNEFKLSLKDDEYTPLFSKDKLYYKENKIHLSEDSDEYHLVGTYILSIDAFIEDAKAQNETFLKILKSGFLKSKH
ncbi:MAG TPA: ATP-binding protein [Bacteroidales bacterium]|nr:ATP-binding protein [Bacteroidales bacterium]